MLKKRNRSPATRHFGARHQNDDNEANLAKVLLDARAAVTRVAKRTQLAMNGLPYEEQGE